MLKLSMSVFTLTSKRFNILLKQKKQNFHIIFHENKMLKLSATVFWSWSQLQNVTCHWF